MCNYYMFAYSFIYICIYILHTHIYICVLKLQKNIKSIVKLNQIKLNQQSQVIKNFSIEKNEKMKNEKCLFSNTQEFLHNIFIKSFK